jgi:hypothetical protein
MFKKMNLKTLERCVNFLNAIEGHETLPYKWKCPISGELMRDPVMACDMVVYERKNIVDWYKKHKQISPVRKTGMNTAELIEQKELEEEIVKGYWSKIDTNLEPKSVKLSLLENIQLWMANFAKIFNKNPPKKLNWDTACVRIQVTFHIITRNKFKDGIDVDNSKLCNTFFEYKDNLDENWWPMGNSPMGVAVWNSCALMRSMVYKEFERFMGNEMEYKRYASQNFPGCLNSGGQFHEKLLHTMEFCIQNLHPEDKTEAVISRLRQNEREIYKDCNSYLKEWMKFWGEKYMTMEERWPWN